MFSRKILKVGIISLIIGAVLGYGISYLNYPDIKDSAEYQTLQDITHQFYIHGIPCFPGSNVEEQVSPDTWVEYNYDDNGNIMMIGIKTTQKQNLSIWGHLPEGRPGKEYEFWDLHVWLQDIEQACLNPDTLIQKLSEEGINVKIADEVTYPFFSVTGKRILVNNDVLEVFEYSTVLSAAQAATQIVQNGTVVGDTKVEWPESPHFYHNGKMIILYLGNDENILKIFTEKISYQFAGE